jgi:hypothetical protein
MLGATAKTETAPKKGKMPTLEAPPEVKAAVDEYQEAKATMKQAEAIMDVTGAVITDYVREKQDADGFARKFSGSYAVMGNRATAKVVYANKYTLSANDEGQLAAVLGLENFNTMIKKWHTVTLKPEVFENPELSGALMELIGDRFADFFETKTSLGVCEEFNKLVYQVLKPADLDDLRVYARQYKPSIR